MSNGDNATALNNGSAEAEEEFSDKPVDNTGQSCACQQKTWIEILLVGEDDKPIPGEKYQIEFLDGTKKEGTLDDSGKARVEELKKEDCRITFPNLDQDAWEGI